QTHSYAHKAPGTVVIRPRLFLVQCVGCAITTNSNSTAVERRSPSTPSQFIIILNQYVAK
ncbi:MAG: hypothetical protein H7831_07935, partial [Magnetococcus sp. WYHC-3]